MCDLRQATGALLQLLVAAAAEAGCGQRLREMGAAEAARRLLVWRHVQVWGMGRRRRVYACACARASEQAQELETQNVHVCGRGRGRGPGWDGVGRAGQGRAG